MYKAYCDEAKAVFLCLMQKKKSQIRLNLRLLAEMVGFEPTFSLRPLRYISKYIFIANLRFVYRKSALKLGIVAVRILLENASFRQVPKPVRASKLTFSRVIWRHPAKHPLGFRVVLVTTTSIHLHIHSYIIIAKSHRSVNTFCRRDPQRQRDLLVRDERKPLPPSAERYTLFFVSAPGSLFHAVLSFPRARL